MGKRRAAALSQEEKRAFNKESFNKLIGVYRFILPYKYKFTVGMIFLGFSSTVLLAFPYLAGKMLDIATGKQDWIFKTINETALIFVGLLIFQAFVSYFRVYLFAYVSQNAMADIRKKVFGKFMYLPMGFYDRNRTGELSSRISNDVTLLQDTLSTTLAEAIRQFATLIFGLAIIFINTPSLSIFMVLTFPVVVFGAIFFGRFIKKLSRKTQDRLAESNVIVEESLQAIFTVKVFTGQLIQTGKYQKAIEESLKSGLKTATIRAGFIAFIISGLFGGIVAVMWYGATLVQSEEIQSGDLVSFLLYTMLIGGSIAGIGDLFGQIQRAIGASERILEILGEADEEESSPSAMTQIEGSISIDNLSFHYPTRPEVPVIDRLSLDIKAGEKVALVGHSGAGKSTIAQLLLRMYPHSSGSISVDNQAIQSYPIDELRGNIGLVPQDVILFGGSIKENIEYGKANASFEEIREAAKRANALDFIEKFPDGFDTLVGERGVKLSGGQRQRIAIARAILKNPKILILDEATSSLDAESESLVQSALDDLMVNRTTIMIAHRLSTIRKADKICVVEAGKIVEAGDHETLYANDQGIYHNLVKLQFETSQPA